MKTRPKYVPTALSVTVFTVGLLLGASSFPGCGGKNDSTPPKSAGPKKNKKPSISAPPSVTRTESRSRNRNDFWEDKSGRKYFGKIPYDVFFDRPYDVASDKTPIASTGKQPKPAGMKTVKTAKKAMPAVKSGGDWSSVINAAILDAEAKRIRNSLSKNLQNVGKFNFGYKTVQFEAATLAAVAHVVAAHDEKVKWKEDALYVRDLATSMFDTAKAPGKAVLDKTKTSFENFDAIMNRSKPAGLKKPEAGTKLVKSAARRGLMRRMDAAHAWLKKDVQDEAVFKAEAEKIKHEAMVLAMLCQVISDPSYDSAEDEEYREFAKNMVDASKEMVAAVNVGSFKNYRSSVDKIINNCNNCHTNYKD